MSSAAPYVFKFIGGNLALDLVNTVGWRDGEPEDRLTSPAEAVRWAKAAGLEASELTKRDLDDLQTARENLHALFRPLASGFPPPAEALSALNARLERLTGLRRLAWREGRAVWAMDASASPLDRLLALILESAAELLVSGETPKLKRCEDAACGWLFLDRSSAGRRRWCRMADCGNRSKAQRHYRRRAGSAQA